jgi:hypothetical protein
MRPLSFDTITLIFRWDFRRLSEDFPDDDILANMATEVEESLLSATQLVGVLNWCVPFIRVCLFSYLLYSRLRYLRTYALLVLNCILLGTVTVKHFHEGNDPGDEIISVE